MPQYGIPQEWITMTSSSRRAVLEAVMISDVLICIASLAISYDLSSHLPLLQLFHTAYVYHPVQRLISLLALALAWHLIFTGVGLYRSHRLSSLREEMMDVLKSSLLATVCLLFWCWLRPRSANQPLHWDLMIAGAFGVVTLAALELDRYIARLILHWLRSNDRNLRYVLVVGTNSRAVNYAFKAKQHKHWGYELVGFADDIWYSADAPEEFKQKLLGSLDEIPHLLRTQALDEVVIALPLASYYSKAAWIASLCRQQGIQVRFEGVLFGDYAGAKELAHIQQPIDSQLVWDDSWSPTSSFLKRLIDIVLSACAIIVTSPLMALIAIAIKTTSEGPALFKQQRVGLGKRRFTIFKFRTMQSNAESMIHSLEHLSETQGPTFKLKNDPRITTIGKFLRKTSLDELPQLFNVFIGDMSLVGPRPLPLRDYEGFSYDWQRKRFSVKPGITCLWQVKGRSLIGFDEWMKLDVHYINNWSVWLDLKILVQTIPAVLRGSGAV
jgi:exopolysaccharide biosynthesis polyprenyl glycosylphosphotransferase